MKKLLLVTLVASLCSSHAISQEKVSKGTSRGKTALYAELGGPAILLSANADTRFRKSHLGWGGRAGVGFVLVTRTIFDPVFTSSYSSEQTAITIPVQVNYLFGSSTSPHTFEAGAGITAMTKKIDPFNNILKEHPTYWYGTMSLMYRRQPVNGGFAWRIGFTPMFSDSDIHPWAALGVGWNF